MLNAMRNRIIGQLGVAACAALALAAQPSTVEAKVRLPKVIGNNMVVQQQTDVRLWGWTEANKTVKVTTSWDAKQVAKAKANKEGYWEVRVETPAASFDPLTITFNDGDELTITGVLAGEVWICAGQSNMEMPVRGFGNCPVEDFNNVALDATEGIRSIKIPSVMSTKPLDDVPAQMWAEWRVSSPQTVPDFSATGYFFAQTLRRAMPGVPIGIIEANKGGTRVESWLSEENLKKYTQENLDSAEIIKKFEWDYHYPLLWGNGTFNPVRRSTVAGIVYYQGCSNVGDPKGQYTDRLKILVDQWREWFGNPELPFYFVQIAPYSYGDVMGINGAELREQQYQATKVIANSGMVCTADLVYPYEREQIHPTRKREVGQRLGFMALKRNYGFSNIIADSPTARDVWAQGDSIYVTFDHMDGGYNRMDDIVGFEVAGADGVYHPAKAGHFWVSGEDKRNESVWVSSPEVKSPKSVRYCFRNFLIGNLGNAGGLPVVPFERTVK